MTPFKITGEKLLKLKAEEVAIILDALVAKPYGQVAGLINNIVEQSRDAPPPPPPPEMRDD